MLPFPLLNFQAEDHRSFLLIAGPCVVESEEILFETAEVLTETCRSLGIPFILKASYRKANRTSVRSFRGIGDERALALLRKAADRYRVPVTTDIHTAEEAAMAAGYVDVLQIPAFLCRQTDLLAAAAATGKVVNIKKGQFLSPASMQFAVEKVRQSGNDQVWLTERGTTFGYQDLVVDFRGIPTMQEFGVPVMLDCTHSVQQPNQSGGVTGGTPRFITTLAKAGLAAGADGLFLETHPRPSEALSDGANMLPLSAMPVLLRQLSLLWDTCRRLDSLST
ncbi:MAG: 3-deoxy-8-phosphooctulonate synthase [Bacteroidota bacterium]|jgi:2-dehydro-3-deoxyphosphooctonate aldolase (KDO 8-P synthase)